MKSKLRKIFLKIVMFYAMSFPSSGLIEYQKSLEELEEEGEIHLGI